MSHANGARHRERAGESEGQSPSDKNRGVVMTKSSCIRGIWALMAALVMFGGRCQLSGVRLAVIGALAKLGATTARDSVKSVNTRCRRREAR